MKKLSMMAAMFGLLTLASCGSDDEASPSNQVTVDGKSYTLSSQTASITSKGSNTDNTRHTMGLMVSTATTEENLSLQTEFSSPGEEFKTGTFEFKTDQTAEDAQYFLITAMVSNAATSSSDQLDVTGGSITLDGSGTNYTVTYDLDLADDKELNGSFSGNFNDMTTMGQ
jgi:hypothetical protein